MIEKKIEIPGQAKPIPVSLSGFTGEAAATLQFDLYVQGFAFTNAESAQYLISGSNNGNLQARATDRINKSTLVAKTYSGASLRRQAHAFADDFVAGAGPQGHRADQDRLQGGQQPEQRDLHRRLRRPRTPRRSPRTTASWPRRAGCRDTWRFTTSPTSSTTRTSFITTSRPAARRAFARYPGSNISPAVSPDGSKVAMILSKDGWVDLYVCDADGSDLKRLTKSRAGRVLALLVAGWAVDLFRGKGERAPDAVQSVRLGRERCSGSRPAACPIPPSRTGRRTASGSSSRRSTGGLPDLRGAGRGRRAPCRWSRAKTRPGRRTRGRWFSVAGGEAGLRALSA